MRRVVVTILFALGLAACATGYQSPGFTGGVSATRIDQRTLQVASQGNSFTDPSTVVEHALLKSAEETLRAGYDWFQVVAAGDNSNDLLYRSGTYATVVNKPGIMLMVRMHSGQVAAGAAEQSYDARQVLRWLGPKYGLR